LKFGPGKASASRACTPNARPPRQNAGLSSASAVRSESGTSRPTTPATSHPLMNPYLGHDGRDDGPFVDCIDCPSRLETRRSQPSPRPGRLKIDSSLDKIRVTSPTSLTPKPDRRLSIAVPRSPRLRRVVVRNSAAIPLCIPANYSFSGFSYHSEVANSSRPFVARSSR